MDTQNTKKRHNKGGCGVDGHLNLPKADNLKN